MKANKQQFEAFCKVRDSGKTNMWDVAKVIELSEVKISREQCLDIMYNFEEYKETMK